MRCTITDRQVARAQAGEAPGGPPAPSDRVRLIRRRERGSHEHALIHSILDEALVAHLGFVDVQGHPVVTPVLHARSGEVVYCHGSVAGRAMRTVARGSDVCLTVSLIDGLVLARAAMHHSANYRSAMLFGRAREVTDDAEKLRASEAIVEHVVPGRWDQVRPPSAKELRATAFLALPIDEASAKVRSGPAVDDEEDHALPFWAGVIPLRTVAGEPQPDRSLEPGTELPPHVSNYVREGLPRR
jgi:hypothetical protein